MVRAHQRLGEGQPEPRPPPLLHGLFVDLLEGAEDDLDLLLGDADSWNSVKWGVGKLVAERCLSKYLLCSKHV
jgi:hypothetical protein